VAEVVVVEAQLPQDALGQTAPTTAVAVAVAAMGHRPYMTPAREEMALAATLLWSHSDGVQPTKYPGIHC
jgi:hypothetical protein